MSKILVIDDEKPTLSMFRLFLEMYGHDPITAENGEEGLMKFASHQPPIVLTDIKMPGMDGIEVLQKIKEQKPLTEVIVITGHGDMDLAIKALNLDATDFINKPIRKEDLESALARAEKRIRLAQDKESEITLTLESNLSIIDFRSNISSGTEAHMHNIFNQAIRKSSGILLRFNEDTSINGAGITLLMQLLTDCAKAGIPTAIAGLSANFRRVFKMMGISDLSSVYETETEARNQLLA